tara:strand:+ start:603 stop:2183 length:1581 start_codon:yes stop_codon:yes gene_type:complete
MPIDKIIRIDLDGRPAINELKKVRGEVDITYAELRRTTPIELDGGKATSELKKVAAETKKTTQGTKDIGTAAEGSSKGFSVLDTAVKGVGLSLKAMGIGLIVSAFVALQQALSKNQVVMDAVNVVLETISITFQNIVNTVVEQGQKVFNFFSKVSKVVKKFTSQDLDGLTSAYEDNNEQTESAIQKNRRLAKEIVKLRNEVKLAEAEQRKLQLTYQKDAELQRQIRDNVSLTVEERIEANKELGRILEKQFQDEKLLADKKIELAEKELAKNKDNVDLQVALTNAQTELADLQERIVGQRSEQLINETTLNQEFQDANKETVVIIKKTGTERVSAEEEVGKQMVIVRKKTNKDLNDATKSAAALDVKTEKLAAEQKLAIIGGTMGQLASVFGEESKAGKALAIGQTLISTYSAAAAALREPPLGAGPIFGPIVAAGAVISGLANVAKIKSTKLPYGDGASASVGGGGSPSVPSVPTGIGGAGLVPNLEGITTAGIGETPPVQAFVVENDISNAQALQQELDVQATL